jgi:hypothetical protein
VPSLQGATASTSLMQLQMPLACDRPLAAAASACPAVVPPGMFVSQGLVRICPQGFYRANYTAFSAPASQICLPCNPGITTDGPGAGNASLCNRVIPGYGLSQVLLSVAGTVTIPALPTPTLAGGLPNATLCAIGFYSSGGYCAQCPSASVTQSMGAKTVEECGECCRARQALIHTRDSVLAVLVLLQFLMPDCTSLWSTYGMLPPIMPWGLTKVITLTSKQAVGDNVAQA